MKYTQQYQFDFDNAIPNGIDPKPLTLQQVIEVAPKEKKMDNTKIITTLRKNAESLINQAEKVNTNVSGNWTHRRQSFADNAQRKKTKMLDYARILARLASDWECEGLDHMIARGVEKIKSATDIEFVFYNGYPRPLEDDDPDWIKREHPIKMKKALSLGLTCKANADRTKAWLINYQEYEMTEDQKKEFKLKEELKKVHAYNIPGFFPTPDSLIDKMLDMAELTDGLSILEPSAGIGSIPDRAKYHRIDCEWSCIEQQFRLCEILKLKGYTASCLDILTITNATGGLVDRIIMNPPFEKKQDFKHIKHCFENFLKPKGILIAIASSSIRNGDSREWLEYHNAIIDDNGQAFKNAFNSTGVSTVTIKIEKP